MAKLSPLEERRRQVMHDAVKRWQNRAGQREFALNAMNALGEPGADTPARNRKFADRSAMLQLAAQLRAQGQLPSAIERRIGPTLDFIENAPDEAARKAGLPVARIVTDCDPKVQAVGFATGFLIAPRLLLTNWHVFPDAASARGNGANFFHERNEQEVAVGKIFELDPDHFFVSNERLDFAIVAVKAKGVDGTDIADLPQLAMTGSPGKILIGQPIKIIQHPDGGPKTWAVENNQLLDVLDEGFLQYSTDTLGGSSGAPVFSNAWELVGLHHSGVPEMQGGQVIADDGSPWTEEMGDERVRWIANEGARISAIVRSLAETRMSDARQQPILDALLEETVDPAEEVKKLVDGPSAGGAPVRLSVSGSQMTFTGPVTIIVGGDAADGGILGVAGFERSLRFDPDYAARRGYQPDFLGEGLIVPAPSVAPGREKEMVALDGKVAVLDYHHYSLAMNRERRLLMWSAANVDYDPARRQTGGRTSFGSDRWIFDPRIPVELQLGDRDFYEPAGQADRGHIVRRQDSAWGDTPEEVEFANSDTFHWTNCTPQHAAFNRGSPPSRFEIERGLWGGFENYIQSELQGGDTRACILAGPVLAADDPVEDFGRGPVAIPVQFWKVVVVKQRSSDTPSLEAYGFMMTQSDILQKFGIEFAPGRYAKYRVPLKTISKIAGIKFDPVVIAAEAAIAR